MSKVNLLILSCGTRNLLVKYFCNCFDSVVGTDCSRLAPALYECDAHYIVPEMNDETYLQVITNICKNEKINAILPLQEDELKLISENRNQFENIGVKVLASNISVIDLCRDKMAFYDFLCSNGLPTLKTWNNMDDFTRDLSRNNVKFPVFVKPRFGMGSKNIGIVETLEELQCRCKNTSGLLIQEYCDGEEYGADVYCDMISGDVIDISIKKKIRMRAGETDKAMTIKDSKCVALIIRLVNELKPICEIDIDIFKKDEEYYISEVNPRFGGGYPHSYLSGMNVPMYIYSNINGVTCDNHIDDEKKQIYTMKYSSIMAVEK